MKLQTQRSRRIRRLAWTLFILTGVYAATGFWVLPAWVRPRAETWAAQALGVPVAIERVDFNPFSFRTQLAGVRIGGADASGLLAWKRLSVNLEPWSLLRREVHLAQVLWEEPNLSLSRDASGNLNWNALLRRLSSEPSAATAASPGAAANAPAADSPGPATPEAQQPARPWSTRIDDLQLLGAKVGWEDLSLAQPYRGSVGPFSIRMAGLETHGGAAASLSFSGQWSGGESFSHEGRFTAAPLSLEGTAEVRGVDLSHLRPYLDGLLRFELRSGRLRARSSYRLAWPHGAEPEMKFTDAEAGVEGLALAEPGAARPFLEARQIEARGVSLDLVADRLSLQELLWTGGGLRAQRARDGSFPLKQLLGFATQVAGEHEVPSARPSREGPGFIVSVAASRLQDFRIDFEDLANPRPAPLALEFRKLQATDLSIGQPSPLRIEADLAWLPAGTVAVQGSVSQDPLRADISARLDGCDLRPVSPYLERWIAAEVASGALSTDLRLHALVPTQGPADLTVTGSARIDHLQAIDRQQASDVLMLESLALSGIDFGTAPRRLKLAEVSLVHPSVLLQRDEQGRFNLGSILVHPPAAAAKPAASAPPPAQASVPGSADLPYEVGAVRLSAGELRWVDRAQRPAASAAWSRIEGTLTGLRSEAGSRSKVDIRGKLLGGPVHLRGDLETASPTRYLDLQLDFEGGDLRPLAPYVGRYLGYELERGGAGLQLAYHIDQGSLRGDNKLLLDPFSLGKSTGSADAVGVPVKLGLAVLRDARGVVEVELPVEGRTDDPEFRLGPIIWKGISSLFIKAATAPFNLLAATFGGGGDDNLQQLDCIAGQAHWMPSEQSRLDILAKAMKERPGLRLGIRGGADAAIDTEALRRLRLDHTVSLWAMDRRGPGADLTAPVSAAERESALRSLAEAVRQPPSPPTPEPAPAAKPAAGSEPRSFNVFTWLASKLGWTRTSASQPAASAAASPTPPTPAPALRTLAEIEAELLAQIEVGPVDLENLALERAQAVSHYLAGPAGIDPDRLLLENSAAPAGEPVQSAQIRFALQ